MSHVPAQYAEGPELKVTRDITSNDVTELIRLMHESLPGYTLGISHSAEGGVQVLADPSHSRQTIGDKSIRFFTDSRFTDSFGNTSGGSTCSPRIIQQFNTRENTPGTGPAMAYTRLHYNNVRTFLKARGGAPAWTIEEIRAVEQAVEQVGFKVRGRRVTARSLRPSPVARST